MTTSIRTCSTCVSFDHIEGCFNAVWCHDRYVRPTEFGQAQPDDVCDDDMTSTEDEAENKAIELVLPHFYKVCRHSDKVFS